MVYPAVIFEVGQKSKLTEKKSIPTQRYANIAMVGFLCPAIQQMVETVTFTELLK